MIDPKRIEMEAGLLSVLAQPTRLKILYFLREGEKCACEINPQMQEDPSVISRHLVKMREAGLLDFRKEGVSIFYWIKDARIFEILDLADLILKATFQERSKMILDSL